VDYYLVSLGTVTDPQTLSGIETHKKSGKWQVGIPSLTPKPFQGLKRRRDRARGRHTQVQYAPKLIVGGWRLLFVAKIAAELQRYQKGLKIPQTQRVEQWHLDRWWHLQQG
jgi:hypothetical protein